MSFQPQFSISARVVRDLEAIATLRTQLATATVHVSWVPQLQKDTKHRGAHASTAIEGNPLTLDDVRALDSGALLPSHTERSRREITNYFAGLRWMERRAANVARVTHEDLFELHSRLDGAVMDQGEAGRYRSIQVRVGKHVPLGAEFVSGLMRELLVWWNGPSTEWSPVISSSVLHYQFENIHPFADGNGRMGRMLALWDLYRRGFDTHHIFSVDEIYWEDRPRYYRELDAVRRRGDDLTGWLEYTTEGLRQILDRVWLRVQRLSAEAGKKQTVLRPRQEQVLHLLRDRGAVAPPELWAALGVTKQGAANILAPLLKSKLVKRIGTKQNGRYVLT